MSLDDEVIGGRIADEPLGEDGSFGDASIAGVTTAQVIVLTAA